MKRLGKIKQGEYYLFPEMVSRFIMRSETIPDQAEISLIWSSTVMPAEEEREQAFEEFRQGLADVLDWNPAQYYHRQVLLHT